MNIGIIGCGFIGRKRALALGDQKLTWTADIDQERARSLSEAVGGKPKFTSDWMQVVTASNVDAVIIATTHDQLAPIALEAAKAGKHILVEKPAARNARELEPVLAAARENRVIAQAGFNHRYHPAFQKARSIFDTGELGPMMYIRARYGHGGRIGYDKEWRANRDISGGGELIDQGMHLIDLSRWFLGEFSKVDGYAPTYFWDMQVEDNAFMALRTSAGQMAWLHATWTEWKNTFSFEIFGKDGKLHIEGLGGSYGVETLTYYRMLPELGPPETTSWQYPFPDRSWELELQDFADNITHKRSPTASLDDAWAALKIVDQIYGASKA